jgi:hypothetical protein
MRLRNQVSAVLVLGFSFGFANGAWAQGSGQQSIKSGEIQKIAPAGMSQETWNRELERCKWVWAELGRRNSLPEDQRAHLPHLYSDIQNCREMSGPARNQYQPPGTTLIDPIKPVLVATPTPGVTSSPSAAVVNSPSSSSNEPSVWQSPTAPPVPKQLNVPRAPAPAASDSLLNRPLQSSPAKHQNS